MRDAAVTTAGYQGTPAPNQWFGGPALSASAGTMVLRNAAGLVVDSLNYGLLVDPWAAEGYHGTSGAGEGGCRVPAPGAGARGGFGFGPAAAGRSTRRTGARADFPDGLDTDSNCNDFLLQPASILSAASAAGATNIKVASVADFAAGQTILIDAGANLEKAVIATVGTPGATTVRAATDAGATVIPVAGGMGFTAGQTITIDSGGNQETAVVASDGPGWPGRARRRTRRRHGHRHGAAQARARGRCAGLRQRHHPHRRIDPGACERGAGRHQPAHARRAKPVFQAQSKSIEDLRHGSR